MSDWGWAVLENIALLAAMCFLIWATNAYWWVLMLVFMNYPSRKDKA